MFSKPLLLLTVQAVNIMHKSALGGDDYDDSWTPEEEQEKDRENFGSAYDRLDLRIDPDLRHEDEKRTRNRRRERSDSRGRSRRNSEDDRRLSVRTKDSDEFDANKIT